MKLCLCVLCLRRTVVSEFYGLIILPSSLPFPPSPLQLTPLYLCKLSNVLSEQAFRVHMQSFIEKEEKTVMLLVSWFPLVHYMGWFYSLCKTSSLHYFCADMQVINMQETTKQMVNHIRIMVEQAEASTTGTQVHYVCACCSNITSDYS